MRALGSAAAALLAVGLAPVLASAFGKIEGPTSSLEATGNVRLLGGFLHYRDLPSLPGDDALLAAVGRVILKGDIATDVSYEAHAYLDLSRTSSSVGGTFSTASSFVSPYRTPRLAWDAWKQDAVAGQLGIDRMSIHARAGAFDFTFGRFPVNDAVAHIFTPNDFFAPFSATAINKAYKPGVDGARVGVQLGRLSQLEVTGIVGSDASGAPEWGQSAVLVRANTVLAGFDVAAIGGKLAERWMAGATFQGDAGPIGVRGEGHLGFADRNGDGTLGEANARGAIPDKIHGRLSVGASYRAVWRNAFIDAEYAYYSDGATPASGYLQRLARLFPDDLPFLGQHYAGLAVGADLMPILRASLLGMVNAGDGSGLAVATLAYDISDESAFVAGVLVPWGERTILPSGTTGGGTGGAANAVLRSEFGLSPVALFLESRFFF